MARPHQRNRRLFVAASVARLGSAAPLWSVPYTSPIFREGPPRDWDGYVATRDGALWETLIQSVSLQTLHQRWQLSNLKMTASLLGVSVLAGWLCYRFPNFWVKAMPPIT